MVQKKVKKAAHNYIKPNANTIIEYAKTIPLPSNIKGIDDITKICRDKKGKFNGAFIDTVLRYSGKYFGIDIFSQEIDKAKDLILKEFINYFNSPVKTDMMFNCWHEKLCNVLIQCFENYNRTFPKQTVNRKGVVYPRDKGYTYGNAQKFINMLFKNIFAVLTKLEHTGTIILPNYRDYFIHCHMPIDSIIISGFLKKEMGLSKTNAKWKSLLNIAWSKWGNYTDYIDLQKEILKHINGNQKYAGLTVLEAEFRIWSASNPAKNSNNNTQATISKVMSVAITNNRKNIEAGTLGENLVLEELKRRGYKPTATSRNAADVDIEAITPSGKKTNIQVKAKASKDTYNEWRIGSDKRSQEKIDKDVWFVFVDLTVSPTVFYIEHSEPALKKAKFRKEQNDNSLVKIGPRKGLPHKPDFSLYFRSSELLDVNGTRKQNNWQDLPN